MTGGAGTGGTVPGVATSAGALGDTVVALIVVAVDADALPLCVTVGVGEAGEFADVGVGVEGVAGVAGAVAG